MKLLLILALFPLTATAQSLQERLSTAPEIPEAEWREMTSGRTVVYEVEGTTYGYESYSSKNNRVTIRLEDNTCVNGQWFMQQTAFCFDWEDGPLNCFHHKRLGDDIYVIGLDGTVENDDIQKVSRIAAIPVSCGPALLSAFHPEE